MKKSRPKKAIEVELEGTLTQPPAFRMQTLRQDLLRFDHRPKESKPRKETLLRVEWD